MRQACRKYDAAMSTRQAALLEPFLVEATAAAVARWGLAQVTVERIAAEAGLSRATLHRRGLTREALIAALAGRAAEQFRAALWPALTGPGSAAKRLQAALEAMLAVADEHLQLLAGMFLAHGEMFHKPGPEALTVDAVADPLERLLRDGAVDGFCARSIPPRPPPCCSTPRAGATSTCAPATAGHPSTPVPPSSTSSWAACFPAEQHRSGSRPPRGRDGCCPVAGPPRICARPP